MINIISNASPLFHCTKIGVSSNIPVWTCMCHVHHSCEQFGRRLAITKFKKNLVKKPLSLHRSFIQYFCQSLASWSFSARCKNRSRPSLLFDGWLANVTSLRFSRFDYSLWLSRQRSANVPSQRNNFSTDFMAIFDQFREECPKISKTSFFAMSLWYFHSILSHQKKFRKKTWISQRDRDEAESCWLSMNIFIVTNFDYGRSYNW